MAEQLFVHGVYEIHVRPIELQGSRWDAEYEIHEAGKTVRRWTTIGGDAGLDDAQTAIDAARRDAIAAIEHGDVMPKPRAFP